MMGLAVPPLATNRKNVVPFLIFLWVVSSYLLVGNVTCSSSVSSSINDVSVTSDLPCGYEYYYHLKYNGSNTKGNIPPPTADDMQYFTKNYINMIKFPTIVSNRNESMAQLNDRVMHILIYFANQPLPDPNVTEDDFEYIPPSNQTNDSSIKDDNDTDDDGLINYMTTNPQFNSRDDVRRFVSRTISRMILQCPGVREDLNVILLHPDTKPFALTGTSFRTNVISDIIHCHRDGDYDFALMDMILLAYILREQQSLFPDRTIISDQAQRILELRLLSGTMGVMVGPTPPSMSTSYELHCTIRNAPNNTIPIDVVIDDTENHGIMTQVARYLINDLLRTYYPNLYNETYDNSINGNTKRMLHYLASFMAQKQFYEYNSKPYQGSTIVALNLLHTFAKDEAVKISTHNILDMITVWNTVQSDHLRRFVPFRRQPKYVSTPQSWAGDLEYQRLSILVGTNNIFPEIGRTEMITTVMSSYRIDPIILDLFFPSMSTSSNSNGHSIPHYFVGHTGVTELYASTEKVLISAGGHSTPARLGTRQVTPVRYSLLCNVQIWYYFNKYVLDFLVSSLSDDERGWSRPTTISPRSYFNNYDINRIIRFIGHRSIEDGAREQNLCVAPNFACGLQLDYGAWIGNANVIANCSSKLGDWTFLNLYSNDSSSKSVCPNDGYYLAIYNRACDVERCVTKADTFGLLEVMEPNNIVNHTNNIDFSSFQEQVLMNNPKVYFSEGVMTYRTISGNTIQFEIHPVDGEASIVRYDNTSYDRDYSHWPIAQSPTIQSTTPGRITIDNSNYNMRRLILDVTTPTQPLRLSGTIPSLRYSKNTAGVNVGGSVFDDSTSFMEDDNIASITCYTNFLLKFVGYRMEWSNGLSVVHGSTGLYRASYILQQDETVVTLSVGTASAYLSLSSFIRAKTEERISFIQIQMNNGKQFKCGGLYGRRNLASFRSEAGERIGALYGRTTTNNNWITQLGVIYTNNTDF